MFRQARLGLARRGAFRFGKAGEARLGPERSGQV